jgi:hypothetical protein
VAWKKLTIPLDNGGLGIRDLSTWNITLLSELLWNLQSKKDTLWVKWINVMYLRGKNIWETSKRKVDSPMWKRLLEINDHLIGLEGSLDLARARLASWGGLPWSASSVYDYFRPRATKVLWKTIVLELIHPTQVLLHTLVSDR